MEAGRRGLCQQAAWRLAAVEISIVSIEKDLGMHCMDEREGAGRSVRRLVTIPLAG